MDNKPADRVSGNILRDGVGGMINRTKNTSFTVKMGFFCSCIPQRQHLYQSIPAQKQFSGGEKNSSEGGTSP